MYAVIGTRDSKLSCPTLVETSVETCHDLFYSVDAAETYTEEQTARAWTMTSVRFALSRSSNSTMKPHEVR
jgi:hypothetical protein